MFLGWAVLADSVPLYPLYALLFVDTGLSDAEISGLLAIWSVVGIVAEVPSGAVADRFSRRGALVAAGVLQAVGYAVWIATPGFAGFAAGFVLWGLGGALVSGAEESLLYDGLAAHGAQGHYAQVNGWVTAAGLLSQIPVAGAATVLYTAGGYDLVGWVSVGTCLAGAVLATRLPEARRPPEVDEDDDEPGYLHTLRAGLREAGGATVRGAVLAVALLSGLDAVDEYFPLITADRGVSTSLVPLAMVGISLAGAAGAAFGGRVSRCGRWTLAAIFGAGVLAFGVTAGTTHPAGLVGVAAFYALYQGVLVVVDARMQDRIGSSSRATVTSVAGLGTEIAGLALFGIWALGGVVAVVVAAAVLAAALPLLLQQLAAPGRGAGVAAVITSRR